MRDLLIELQYLFRKDGNQIPNQAVVMGAGSGTDGQKAVDIQHQGLGGATVTTLMFKTEPGVAA